MEAGIAVAGLIGLILIMNLGKALGGSKKEVEEEPKPKVKAKKEPQTAKACYGDACKQVKQLEASIKKMQKNATTAQDKKLLSNLEGKILNLV